jgi:hypothetical protein
MDLNLVRIKLAKQFCVGVDIRSQISYNCRVEILEADSVNKSQKLVLAALVVAAAGVAIVVAATLFFLLNDPPNTVSQAPAPVAAAIVATLTATASPVPATATSTPSQPTKPTPTGTRVVQVTVLPSPTPTLANCGGAVINFGASGVITNDDVRLYLQNVIPTNHLDRCRGIEYVPVLAKSHGTDIAGNIIPVYREIFVYALEPEFLSAEYLLDTLVHEIGHNVQMNIRRDDLTLEQEWTQIHRQSQDMFGQNGTGFVSDYARTNKFEDFAESYRAYIRTPDALITVNPAKYEFFRANVFNGREYH